MTFTRPILVRLLVTSLLSVGVMPGDYCQAQEASENSAGPEEHLAAFGELFVQGRPLNESSPDGESPNRRPPRQRPPQRGQMPGFPPFGPGFPFSQNGPNFRPQGGPQPGPQQGPQKGRDGNQQHGPQGGPPNGPQNNGPQNHNGPHNNGPQPFGPMPFSGPQSDLQSLERVMHTPLFQRMVELIQQNAKLEAELRVTREISEQRLQLQNERASMKIAAIEHNQKAGEHRESGEANLEVRELRQLVEKLKMELEERSIVIRQLKGRIEELETVAENLEERETDLNAQANQRANRLEAALKEREQELSKFRQQFQAMRKANAEKKRESEQKDKEKDGE